MSQVRRARVRNGDELRLRESRRRQRTCDFRSGKIILQQPIERAQMQKLLATGKTDLLEKFISRKGRPFKAFLVVKDGKVGFEFEPREPKARKPAAKAGADRGTGAED